MFTAANRMEAEGLSCLANSLAPDEVYLNTPLRPSPTSPLSAAAMQDIAKAFRGLRTAQIYGAPPRTTTPLDKEATRRRRPEY